MAALREAYNAHVGARVSPCWRLLITMHYTRRVSREEASSSLDTLSRGIADSSESASYIERKQRRPVIDSTWAARYSVQSIQSASNSY